MSVHERGRSRAAPVVLLLLFVLVLRVLPGLTRPASPPDDCQRSATTDLPAMERCLASRPDDVELMLDIGSAYESAGQSERARTFYARALDVDPRDAGVRARLQALQTPAGR